MCMKYYAVEYTYRSDADVAATRPAHRKYLASLRDQGKLLGGGPLIDAAASALIIFKASDEKDCEEMIGKDPMQTEGVMEYYSITEWNPVTRDFDVES